MNLLEALIKHGRELKDRDAKTVMGRGLTRQQLAVLGFEKRDLERAVRRGHLAKVYVGAFTVETFYYIRAEEARADGETIKS